MDQHPLVEEGSLDSHQEDQEGRVGLEDRRALRGEEDLPVEDRRLGLVDRLDLEEDPRRDFSRRQDFSHHLVGVVSRLLDSLGDRLGRLGSRNGLCVSKVVKKRAAACCEI